jgi:putative tributyrin esterase
MLRKTNQDYRDCLLSHKADLTFEEGPGSHERDFWGNYIKKFIDWLPLDKNAEAGISSGYIGVDSKS